MGAIVSIAIIIISILGVSGWYFFQHDPPSDSSGLTVDITTVPTQSNNDHGGIQLTTLDGTPIISPTTIPAQITVYSQLKIIDSQPVIVYAPTQTTKDTQIILYSHGSNEHITENGPTPQFFVEALDSYGNYFAKKDVLFVASEMYGENWGSSEAVTHMKNVLDELRDDYEITGNTYLYGYSMGGLPTLRFAKTYPEYIDKIALLAPTIHMPDWNIETLDKINKIPIRIWHGTKDVNVPPSVSESFYEAAVSAGHLQITRNTITNETHRHFLSPTSLWEFFQDSDKTD